MTTIINVCVIVKPKVIDKPTKPAGKTFGIATTKLVIDAIIIDDIMLILIIIQTGIHVFARKNGTNCLFKFSR